jgi:hypothetical protein
MVALLPGLLKWNECWCSCMIVPVNHGIIACEEAKGIFVSIINYGRV